jgi:hypothetical protein
MTTTRSALVTIQQMMDKAQGALHRNAWFEAERLAARSLDLARAARDFGLMARITLPLQEARRQRLQLAFDAAEASGKLHLVQEPFGEDVRPEAGCHLVQPPLVGADARRLRLAAFEQETPIAVLCREPRTKLKLCPIVSIGQVTIRTKIDPPSEWDRPTLAWFISAMESLGDAAIETLDTGMSHLKQVDALLARLDAWPDHEKLHQALAEACREAARDVAEGRPLDDEPAAEAIDPLEVEAEAEAEPDADEEE